MSDEETSPFAVGGIVHGTTDSDVIGIPIERGFTINEAKIKNYGPPNFETYLRLTRHGD